MGGVGVDRERWRPGSGALPRGMSALPRIGAVGGGFWCSMLVWVAGVEAGGLRSRSCRVRVRGLQLLLGTAKCV